MSFTQRMRPYMNIVSYLNDPYSIDQTINHLIRLFSQNANALKKQISKQHLLKLRFGEMGANGDFIELKLPKAFKQKYTSSKQLSSELLYFDVLTQQGQHDKALCALTDAITLYNRKHPPLWSDTHTFLGINISIPMAVKDCRYIPALIHFLSSTEINSEMSLSDDLNRVFQSHGWHTGTLDLLAARATILEGSSGHQHINALLQNTTLTETLENPNLENALLEKLTGYAMINFANHQGRHSPSATIENAMTPFRNISKRLNKKINQLTAHFVEHFPNCQPCLHQLYCNQTKKP